MFEDKTTGLITEGPKGVKDEEPGEVTKTTSGIWKVRDRCRGRHGSEDVEEGTSILRTKNTI